MRRIAISSVIIALCVVMFYLIQERYTYFNYQNISYIELSFSDGKRIEIKDSAIIDGLLFFLQEGKEMDESVELISREKLSNRLIIVNEKGQTEEVYFPNTDIGLKKHQVMIDEEIVIDPTFFQLVEEIKKVY